MWGGVTKCLLLSSSSCCLSCTASRLPVLTTALAPQHELNAPSCRHEDKFLPWSHTSIEVWKPKKGVPTCISLPRLSKPRPALSDTEWWTRVWKEQSSFKIIKVLYAGCPPLRTWGFYLHLFFNVYTRLFLLFVFLNLCICLFVETGFVFCFYLEVKAFLLQPLECRHYTHPLHTHSFVLVFSNSLISVFPNILCSYRPTQL